MSLNESMRASGSGPHPPLPSSPPPLLPSSPPPLLPPSCRPSASAPSTSGARPSLTRRRRSSTDRSVGSGDDATGPFSQRRLSVEENLARCAAVSGETEHLRLLRIMRDTHVWADGKRYCELKAESAWQAAVQVS
jgi:hypothetical protein